MPGPSQSISKDPVFCSECYYYQSAHLHANSECRHPDNRNKKNDNWLRRDTAKHRKPWKINKKNNCPWYDAAAQRGGWPES
jgi:hypothetical protein